MNKHIDKQMIILIVLLLAGICLLGGSITGFVVSQSCCFPPDCSDENICAAANPYLGSPLGFSQNLTAVSFSLFLISLSLLIIKMKFHSKAQN